MILLFGDQGDGWMSLLSEYLETTDVDRTTVTEAEIYDGLQMRYDIPPTVDSSFFVRERGSIPFQSIQGVLVRLSPAFLSHRASLDSEIQYLAYEFSAILHGVLNALPCTVVNRPIPAGSLRQPGATSIAQVLRCCGFEVPAKLTTGSAAQGLEFFRSRGKRVLLKLWSGTRHHLVDDEADMNVLLGAYGGSLEMFEAPTGKWYRVIVAGETVAAQALETGPGSQLLEAIGTEPISRLIQERCKQLAALLDLHLAEFLIHSAKQSRITIYEIKSLPESDWSLTPLREELAAAVSALWFTKSTINQWS